MKQISKSAVVGLAALASGATLASASAEPVGSYIGQTADGNAVRFDLVTDNKGHLALADLSLSFTAACGVSGSAVTQSWQFFFSKGLPVTKGRVKHVENSPQLYVANNLKFDGKHVTGTTEARLPVFGGNGSSGGVQLCVSAKQAVEATFQSADSTNPFEHSGTARFKSPERTAILEWSSQGVDHQELRKE